jgi:hypothetical protein
MEIIKEIFSQRLDYLQALKKAPSPLNSLSGKSGKSAFQGSSEITVPKNLTGASTASAASPGGSDSSTPNSSGMSFWKPLLFIAAVTGLIILLYKSSKDEEENK